MPPVFGNGYVNSNNVNNYSDMRFVVSSSSTQGWDHPDDSNDDDYDIPSIGIIRQCIVVNVTLER